MGRVGEKNCQIRACITHCDFSDIFADEQLEPPFPHTLYERTLKVAVDRQVLYAWGVADSVREANV